MSEEIKVEKEFKPEKDNTVLITWLLWFFLGCYGAHNFYRGEKKKGFIKLGLLAALLVFVIGSFIFALLGSFLDIFYIFYYVTQFIAIIASIAVVVLTWIDAFKMFKEQVK